MDYSKLSDADKQALIDYCKSRISESASYSRISRCLKITLESLNGQHEKTMQPVKAPKQERGTYPPARIKQVRDMEWIMAIRDAGGTVQESE